MSVEDRDFMGSVQVTGLNSVAGFGRLQSLFSGLHLKNFPSFLTLSRLRDNAEWDL